jgi:hypothetical protein
MIWVNTKWIVALVADMQTICRLFVSVLPSHAVWTIALKRLPQILPASEVSDEIIIQALAAFRSPNPLSARFANQGVSVLLETLVVTLA